MKRIGKIKTVAGHMMVLVAMTSLSFAPLGSAYAASITDAASCQKAVQQTEAQVLKTDMQPDVFNQIVGDADAAKAACDANDFAKAEELLNLVRSKLAALPK